MTELKDMPDNQQNTEMKKHAGGRPSKFDAINWNIVERMYKSGFVDKEVCEILKIDESTLTKWKQSKEEFFTSLKSWKAEADEKVERSLFERATGYEHEDTYFSNFQGIVTATPYTKHYPPDATSMIFWLKNRQPDKWRDKTEVDIPNGINLVINGISKL